MLNFRPLFVNVYVHVHVCITLDQSAETCTIATPRRAVVTVGDSLEFTDAEMKVITVSSIDIILVSRINTLK